MSASCLILELEANKNPYNLILDAFDLGAVTSECNETSGLRSKYFEQTFPTVQQRGQDTEMPLSNLVNADIGFILRMGNFCFGVFTKMFRYSSVTVSKSNLDKEFTFIKDNKKQ